MMMYTYIYVFIDPLYDPGSGEGPAAAIRVGRYKLIKGRPGTYVHIGV